MTTATPSFSRSERPARRLRARRDAGWWFMTGLQATVVTAWVAAIWYGLS